MSEMKMKLLTKYSWTSTSATQDGIALLKMICDFCHKKDSSTNVTILDLVHMDKYMYLIHQAPNKLLSSYLSKFMGAVDVVELLGGSLWSQTAAMKIVFNKLYTPSAHTSAMTNNSTEYQAATAEAQRCYLAALFFLGLRNKPTRN